MGLDTVELVLALEEHFRIEIPDDAAEKMTTPGHLFEFIIGALEAKRNAVVPEIAREVVWSQIVDIFVRQLGVRPDQVTRDTDIVKDLRVD